MLIVVVYNFVAVRLNFLPVDIVPLLLVVLDLLLSLTKVTQRIQHDRLVLYLFKRVLMEVHHGIAKSRQFWLQVSDTLVEVHGRVTTGWRRCSASRHILTELVYLLHVWSCCESLLRFLGLLRLLLLALILDGFDVEDLDVALKRIIGDEHQVELLPVRVCHVGKHGQVWWLRLVLIIFFFISVVLSH